MGMTASKDKKPQQDPTSEEAQEEEEEDKADELHDTEVRNVCCE
jgi:hypothetical protein